MRRSRMPIALLLWGLLALDHVMVRAQEARPIAIVASSDWRELGALSLPMLRRIYMGQVTRLAGRRVEPLHQRSGSPVRQSFSLAVLGQSEARLEDWWLEQALTGGGVPPREVADGKAMLEEIRRRPGGLGYVALAELRTLDVQGLRILPIADGSRRLEPIQDGYPITLR